MPRGVAGMTSFAEWANRDTLVRYLAGQLVEGRLALVLGAGISVSSKIPDWKMLLNRICDGKKLAHYDFGTHSPEQAAGHLKREAFSNDDFAFNTAVREALYSDPEFDPSFEAMREELGLAGVAALVMASHRGTVSNVMTFNFDDVLERYLRYHGYVVKSVSGDANWATRADVEVFHPHGLLPVDASAPMSASIVFTRNDFGQVVGDSANPWNQLALSFMRRNTCLFLGLSGNDNRLFGLLDRAQASHAIRSGGGAMYWGVRFTDTLDDVVDGEWTDKKVWVQRVADYQTDLPKFLFSIVQAAAEM